MTHPEPGSPPARGWRWRNLRLSSVVWGAVVWVALWGDLSVANVLSGALLGLLVAVVFPLPPLPGGVRLRPLAVLQLVAVFAGEVVMASAQVIRVILLPGDLRNSVVEVTLRSDSDLVTTIVGEMTSLVPGSITVDVRRSDHTLYLHALYTPDHDAVREVRERTYALEARVLAALGMSAARESASREPAAGGGDR